MHLYMHVQYVYMHFALISADSEMNVVLILM